VEDRVHTLLVGTIASIAERAVEVDRHSACAP